MRQKKIEKQTAQGMRRETVHMKNIQGPGNKLCHKFTSGQQIMGSGLESVLQPSFLMGKKMLEQIFLKEKTQVVHKK